MKHSLLVAYFDTNTWDRYKNPVREEFAKIRGQYVEIKTGMWFLKIKEAYPIIHSLMSFFREQHIAFVLVPIGPDLPTVCVTSDMAQKLGDLGVEVYNLAVPDQAL